uniref:Uncharacterized protein n=1 Tax=viral metagenome TaxID=1070528 RepID=A0A6C0AZ42_9ZZZZ
MELPNLSSYEMFSLIVIPFSLFFFGADFLRDRDIKKDETKIGIVQYIHHLAFTTNMSGLILSVFLTCKIPFVTFLMFLSIINQVGWLLNDDNCWLTQYANTIIGAESKNRKWIAEISSLVKHYVKGDEWAYSEMRPIDRTRQVIISNGLILAILIKIIIAKKIKAI